MTEGRRPVCILVVEDEPVVALHLRAELAGLGFEDVRCAHRLEAARELVRSAAPALAILDVNLDETVVFPLAQELRERGVPIVFSSGRGREALPPEWADYPFVEKPFEVHELAAAIERLGVPRHVPATPSG